MPLYVLGVWVVSSIPNYEDISTIGMYYVTETRPVDSDHAYLLHLTWAQFTFGAFGTNTLYVRTKNVNNWSNWSKCN